MPAAATRPLTEVTIREALPPVQGGGMFVARRNARQARLLLIQQAGCQSKYASRSIHRLMATVRPKPRSRPHAWRARQRRRGYRRPVPKAHSRMPKGVLTFWTRARRLLWSWWPWALVSIWAIGNARWGWAIGAGTM